MNKTERIRDSTNKRYNSSHKCDEDFKKKPSNTNGMNEDRLKSRALVFGITFVRWIGRFCLQPQNRMGKIKQQWNKHKMQIRNWQSGKGAILNCQRLRGNTIKGTDACAYFKVTRNAIVTCRHKAKRFDPSTIASFSRARSSNQSIEFEAMKKKQLQRNTVSIFLSPYKSDLPPGHFPMSCWLLYESFFTGLCVTKST